MSGPKVVNIESVRRQQKRQCLACLKELRLVIAECERLQPQVNAEVLLQRLEGMGDAGQWEALWPEALQHLEFYREEAKRLGQKHAAAQADALRRNHRLRQGVAQMTAKLYDLPDTPERNQLITQLASVDSTAQQTALERALDLITQNTQNDSASELRHLAAAFADSQGEDRPKLVSPARQDPQEQRLDRCWSLLGELAALEDSEALRRLTEKAQQVALIANDQRALLLDSLVLELSECIKRRKADQAVRSDLDMLLAELSELSELTSPMSTAWKEKLATALALSASLEDLQSLAQEARIWIESAIAEENRLAQRTAVLQALASVGYEIREGMATAWAEEGRIVIQKPAENAYGIELSAPAQGTAFQTRVIALTNTASDPQRDREVEETWCGDFKHARAQLEECGFATTLVRAEAPGAVPVKSIAGSQTSDNRRRTGESRPSSRKNLPD